MGCEVRTKETEVSKSIGILHYKKRYFSPHIRKRYRNLLASYFNHELSNVLSWQVRSQHLSLNMEMLTSIWNLS